MLNKPRQYLCHRTRSFGKKSILELFDLPKAVKNQINPVGRLDYESEGLIILTNDGDFANRILQPKTKLEKEYEVLVKGELDERTKERLEQGIEIEVGGDERKGQPKTMTHKTLPAMIRIIDRSTQVTRFSIIIQEGKKRQIREMMKAVKLKVLSLKRIRIGNLTLGDLKEGAYKTFMKDSVFGSSPR